MVFLGTVLRNLIAKVPGQPCFLCKKGEPVKGTESKGGLKTEKAILDSWWRQEFQEIRNKMKENQMCFHYVETRFHLKTTYFGYIMPRLLVLLS